MGITLLPSEFSLNSSSRQEYNTILSIINVYISEVWCVKEMPDSIPVHNDKSTFQRILLRWYKFWKRMDVNFSRKLVTIQVKYMFGGLLKCERLMKKRKTPIPERFLFRHEAKRGKLFAN